MPPVSFGLTLALGPPALMGKATSAGDSFGSAHTGGGTYRNKYRSVSVGTWDYGPRETIMEVDVT